PPFPPARTLPPDGLPAPLTVAAELATLGFLAEASAEADWFVQHHAGDAGVAALPIYERAGRADRAVLFAIALLGDRGPRAPRAILEGAYPAAFPAQVARAAERTGIDPYLVLAVMRRESLFKADVRSAAGAVGLLQLLPATARRAAVVLGRPPLRDEQLVDPGTAIDLGGRYRRRSLGLTSKCSDPTPSTPRRFFTEAFVDRWVVGALPGSRRRIVPGGRGPSPRRAKARRGAVGWRGRSPRGRRLGR